jgi:hypothetical protein
MVFMPPLTFVLTFICRTPEDSHESCWFAILSSRTTTRATGARRGRAESGSDLVTGRHRVVASLDVRLDLHARSPFGSPADSESPVGFASPGRPGSALIEEHPAPQGHAVQAHPTAKVVKRSPLIGGGFGGNQLVVLAGLDVRLDLHARLLSVARPTQRVPWALRHPVARALPLSRSDPPSEGHAEA